MSDDSRGFVGSIPENYDRGLGPIAFADYAEHTARLVAGYAPSRVLETGAGTGIVTRRLLLENLARHDDIEGRILEGKRVRITRDEFNIVEAYPSFSRDRYRTFRRIYTLD